MDFKPVQDLLKQAIKADKGGDETGARMYCEMMAKRLALITGAIAPAPVQTLAHVAPTVNASGFSDQVTSQEQEAAKVAAARQQAALQGTLEEVARDIQAKLKTGARVFNLPANVPHDDFCRELDRLGIPKPSFAINAARTGFVADFN